MRCTNSVYVASAARPRVKERRVEQLQRDNNSPETENQTFQGTDARPRAYIHTYIRTCTYLMQLCTNAKQEREKRLKNVYHRKFVNVGSRRRRFCWRVRRRGRGRRRQGRRGMAGRREARGRKSAGLVARGREAEVCAVQPVCGHIYGFGLHWAWAWGVVAPSVDEVQGCHDSRGFCNPFVCLSVIGPRCVG